MPKFGPTSRERLRTLHPDLKRILTAVIRHTDCTIIFGHRDEAEQTRAFDERRSKFEFPNSLHNEFPSLAVDVAPWPIPKKWGADDWKERVKFYELAAVIRHAAAAQNVELRWGGDWDGDADYCDSAFDDLVHFELKRAPMERAA